MAYFKTSSMKQDLVLIDICGTLFNSNTTFDFMSFHFGNKSSYLLFRKLTKTYSWRLLNKVLIGIFNWDVTRALAVKWLRGFSKDQLKDMALLFYDNFLISRIQAEVIHKMNTFKDRGNTLILVSATLDFIAKEVAHRMAIPEYYSTQLKYNTKDYCSGKIKVDLLKRKQYFLDKNGIRPPYQTVITDNFSDMDLIKNSTESIIICSLNKKKKWERLLATRNIKNYTLLCI
jgi:phosphoserine phosphatase